MCRLPVLSVLQDGYLSASFILREACDLYVYQMIYTKTQQCCFYFFLLCSNLFFFFPKFNLDFKFSAVLQRSGYLKSSLIKLAVAAVEVSLSVPSTRIQV